MKHIKKFERSNIPMVGINNDDPYLISDNENLPDDTKFKIGDYVNYKNNTKYLYEIKKYYIKGEYECFMTWYPEMYERGSRTWSIEDDLELTPKEAIDEHLLKAASIKYNL